MVARDLPGFGHARPLSNGDRHSVPNLADAVEGWIDEEGLESPHLVGCSLGGAIALELAARGRAKSATAISPASGTTRGFEAEWAFRQVRQIRDGARRMEKLGPERTRRLLDNPAIRLTLYTQFGRPYQQTTDSLLASQPLLANAPGFDDANDSLFHEYSLIDVSAPRLAEVRVPTQILWGSRDLCLWPRQARRVADAIPGAKLRFLPGLGHLSMLDDPDLIAELVVDHARGPRPGRGAPALA